MRHLAALAVIILAIVVAPATAHAEEGLGPRASVTVPFADLTVSVAPVAAPNAPPPQPMPIERIVVPGSGAARDVVQAAKAPDVAQDLPLLSVEAGGVTVTYAPRLPTDIPVEDAIDHPSTVERMVHQEAVVTTLTVPSPAEAAEQPSRRMTGHDGAATATGLPYPGATTVQGQPMAGAFLLTDPVTVTLGVAGGLMLLLGLLALYHRTRNREVLEHATRGRIMDLVRERPGITLQELAKETDTQYDSVVYHVERLRKENLLVRSGKKPIRLFDPSFPCRDRIAVTALLNDGCRQVLEAVLASPGTPKAAIGRTLGLTGPSVTWHVEKLEAGGLVTIWENKPGLGMKITADVERLRAICRRLASRGEELPSLL